MKDFVKGVRYYTTGKMEISVHFPENDVCCFHCWARYKDSGDRQMCRLMGRELYYIKEGIHEDCPLQFEEGENG